MSEEFWQVIYTNNRNMPVLPVNGVSVTAAFNNKSQKISKQSLITIKLGQLFYEIPVLVIPHLSREKIIGADWLSEEKAEINFEEGFLKCGTKPIKNHIPFVSSNKTPITAQAMHLRITTNEYVSDSSEVLELRTIDSANARNKGFLKGSQAANQPDRVNERKGFREQVREQVAETPGLTSEQKLRLEALLTKYQDVFSDKPGKVKGYEHCIHLTDHTPFVQKSYPIPIAKRPE
jgi:hypothetical protein